MNRSEKLGWTGFTDEDLRKLKQSCVSIDASAKGRQPKHIGRGTGGQRLMTPASEALPANQRLAHLQPEQSSLPSNHRAGLVHSSEPDTAQHDVPNPQITGHHDSTGTGSVLSSMRQGRQRSSNKTFKTHSLDTDVRSHESSSAAPLEGDCDSAVLVLDEKTILSRELVNMDKFRDQQKMMEELNKKKKAMLTLALQERQKKAKVEAVRLTQIRHELEKLDQLVVSDVSIIRNKIEEASREYLEAQKRYTRAEKEFVESKIDLHKKLECKDQLTEHLYTVIHQNELRKAKKLTELMEKLEMESGGEEEAITAGEEIIPPPVLCVINPAVETKMNHLQAPSAAISSGNITEVEEIHGAALLSSNKTSAESLPLDSSLVPALDKTNSKKNLIKTAVSGSAVNKSTSLVSDGNSVDVVT